VVAGPRMAVAFAVLIAVAACAPSSDSESSREPDDQQVIEGDKPDDAVETEVGEPASPDAPPTSVVEPLRSEPPRGPATSEPETPAPSGPVPGMFADDQTTELAVSILLSQSGPGSGHSVGVGVGVGLANREVNFDGSPFEFGVEGKLSAPVAFNDDGDLTEDLDKLRVGIDESLEAPSTDLFVGAVPPSLVAETTELAAERGIPTVLVNHVDDVSAPQLGVRLDLAGSTDLSYRALVGTVVAAETDGIVIVGPVGDPDTALVEQLLIAVGAAPEIVDAPATTPSPGALEDAREQIAGIGDRPAVILLSQPWARPIIATMAQIQSDPSFISTDLTLSRDDVGAIGNFGESELTMVRRVDDARRPEQSDFFERLFAGQPKGSSTHAAESYDAYALAAIAAATEGSADSATIRSGMIEASRGGEVCSVLADCLTLAADGVDVDYEGESGPIDLGDDGVATAIWFSIDVADSATGGDASSQFVLQRS
jgi:hypothetical protein